MAGWCGGLQDVADPVALAAALDAPATGVERKARSITVDGTTPALLLLGGLVEPLLRRSLARASGKARR